MECELIPTLIVVLVFVVIVKKWKSCSDPASVDLNRIPGPRKLPVIGNLHLLVSKSPPHHVFRDLAAKHGALMRLQLGQVPFLIVSSVEAAREVLKTMDTTFANRPRMLAATTLLYNHTDVVFSPYGEYWRKLRSICTLELLSARRVKLFRPLREEEFSKLADGIASSEGSPDNLSERVNLSSFDIATRACVGKSTEEKRQLTGAIKEAIKMDAGLSLPDLYPSIGFLPLLTGMKSKVQRIFRQTDGALESIINGRKAAKATAQTTHDAMAERSQDITDVLLKYQEDGAEVHLTNDNVKAVIMDIFLAGGETSSTTVDWAMSELIRNPSVLERAQDEVRRTFDDKGYVDEDKFDELKYLKLVIKEVLRLHPPLPLLIPRYSSANCEVNGYVVPAQSRVIINAWALGRDPKYWNDPEKFMPERFKDSPIDFKGNNYEYIPFGAGRRMCPGMAFGLANVESSLSKLLYHFDWKMPYGMKPQDLDMKEDLGAVVKRKHDLILIPTLARPLNLIK